jgi:hypothetical protein
VRFAAVCDFAVTSSMQFGEGYYSESEHAILWCNIKIKETGYNHTIQILVQNTELPPT